MWSSPIPWVVGLVVLALLAASALRRSGVAPELTRKAAHVGASLSVLPLAATGLTPRSAALLAAGFAALIATLRALGRLEFLDGVRRPGPSQYAFIGGLAFLLVVGRDHELALRTTILVLGVCDAIAAIVGRRIGRHKYRIGTGHRSLEGSAAFAASAMLVIVASSGFSGATITPRDLLAAGVVAIVVASVEALSVRGFDNLSVPLVTFAFLSHPNVAALCLGLVPHLVTGAAVTVLLVRQRVPPALALATALLGFSAALLEQHGPWTAIYVASVASIAVLRTDWEIAPTATFPRSER